MSIVLTLAVFGTWATLALGLSAIGVFFFNRLGGTEPTWFSIYYSIWTGFALLIASLVLWHFVLPVNDRALVTFAGLAALALIVERRWFTSVRRLPCNRRFAVALIVFAIWTANHALAGGGYDDYIYEFQAIRWFHDYPIVPGLANLHGPIGFNNSHHLFAAMLSAGLWRGAVNHIFNGFFVVLACVFLLNAVRDIPQGTKGSLERSLFPALLVCPCVGLVWFGTLGPMLPTLKADVFVAAATAVLACLFLRWTAAPTGSSESAVLAATTLVVGAVIPSVKISALAFCGFIVAVVALRSLLQLRLGLQGKSMIVGALVVVAVLAISVPIRGIVLSGCPLYPSAALRLNVDWAVPVAQADAERAFITSSARLHPTCDPHEVSGWLWIPEWARTIASFDRINILLPLVLTLVCIPLLFVERRGDPRVSMENAPPRWAYATLACASVASLIVWFVQAPAERFAIVNFWILFATVFTWGLQKQRGGWSWKASLIGLLLVLPLTAFVLLSYLDISGEYQLRVLVLLTFAALWIVVFGLLRVTNPRLLALLCILPALFQYGEFSARYLLSEQYADLRSMLWINVSQLPRRAPPTTVLRQTRSGLEIYEGLKSTFETPLPNTPYFNPFLQLRTTRMKDGFRNSAPVNSAACGKEIYTANTR
ncbi:MAG TPA: hypothetical protein VKG65_03595 [Terriglobales bacterium]|nr:hypothetical protein [Terriglobales bacterium]